jgi:DNA-binding NtrC family response regulator
MHLSNRVIEFPKRPEEVVSVLHLSPWEEDRRRLERIFENTNWKLTSADSLRDACAVLRRTMIPVLLTDTRLPDATWQDIVQSVSRYEPAPRIIATYRFAESDRVDSLLATGAYDVIAKPLDVTEVVQSISFAWMRWRKDWAMNTPPRRPPVSVPASMAAAAKASG